MSSAAIRQMAEMARLKALQKTMREMMQKAIKESVDKVLRETTQAMSRRGIARVTNIAEKLATRLDNIIVKMDETALKQFIQNNPFKLIDDTIQKTVRGNTDLAKDIFAFDNLTKSRVNLIDAEVPKVKSLINDASERADTLLNNQTSDIRNFYKNSFDEEKTRIAAGLTDARPPAVNDALITPSIYANNTTGFKDIIDSRRQASVNQVNFKNASYYPSPNTKSLVDSRTAQDALVQRNIGSTPLFDQTPNSINASKFTESSTIADNYKKTLDSQFAPYNQKNVANYSEYLQKSGNKFDRTAEINDWKIKMGSESDACFMNPAACSFNSNITSAQNLNTSNISTLSNQLNTNKALYDANVLDAQRASSVYNTSIVPGIKANETKWVDFKTNDLSGLELNYRNLQSARVNEVTELDKITNPSKLATINSELIPSSNNRLLSDTFERNKPSATLINDAKLGSEAASSLQTSYKNNLDSLYLDLKTNRTKAVSNNDLLLKQGDDFASSNNSIVSSISSDTNNKIVQQNGLDAINNIEIKTISDARFGKYGSYKDDALARAQRETNISNVSSNINKNIDGLLGEANTKIDSLNQAYTKSDLGISSRNNALSSNYANTKSATSAFNAKSLDQQSIFPTRNVSAKSVYDDAFVNARKNSDLVSSSADSIKKTNLERKNFFDSASSQANERVTKEAGEKSALEAQQSISKELQDKARNEALSREGKDTMWKLYNNEFDTVFAKTKSGIDEIVESNKKLIDDLSSSRKFLSDSGNYMSDTLKVNQKFADDIGTSFKSFNDNMTKSFDLNSSYGKQFKEINDKNLKNLDSFDSAVQGSNRLAAKNKQDLDDMVKLRQNESSACFKNPQNCSFSNRSRGSIRKNVDTELSLQNSFNESKLIQDSNLSSASKYLNEYDMNVSILDGQFNDAVNLRLTREQAATELAQRNSIRTKGYLDEININNPSKLSSINDELIPSSRLKYSSAIENQNIPFNNAFKKLDDSSFALRASEKQLADNLSSNSSFSKALREQGDNFNSKYLTKADDLKSSLNREMKSVQDAASDRIIAQNGQSALARLDLDNALKKKMDSFGTFGDEANERLRRELASRERAGLFNKNIDELSDTSITKSSKRITDESNLANKLDGYNNNLISKNSDALSNVNRRLDNELNNVSSSRLKNEAKDKLRNEVRDKADNQLLQDQSNAALNKSAKESLSEAEEKIQKESLERAQKESAQQSLYEAEEKSAKELKERAQKDAVQREKDQIGDVLEREARDKAETEAQQRISKELDDRALKETQNEAAEKIRKETAEETKDRAEREAKEELSEKSKREADDRLRREGQEEASEKGQKEAADRTKRELSEEERERLAKEAREKARKEALERERKDLAEKLAAKKARKEALSDMLAKLLKYAGLGLLALIMYGGYNTPAVEKAAEELRQQTETPQEPEKPAPEEPIPEEREPTEPDMPSATPPDSTMKYALIAVLVAIVVAYFLFKK